MVRPGQSHAHTGSRRLVHLAEDEGGVLQHARLFHLHDEVVALTGALPHAGEHGGTGELAGDTGDHLLDQHGLAHAGAAEQADLAALHVRGEQVDDLDAGLQDLGLALELVEGGGSRWMPHCSPSRPRPGSSRQSPSALKTWPLTTSPTGTEIGLPVSRDLGTTDQAVGRLHGDGAHQVVAQVLRHLQGHRSWQPPRRVTSTVSALYSAGIASRGNSMSTTGPMTRTTRPATAEAWCSARVRAVVIIYVTFFRCRSSAAGATDDLCDFLGDLRLTRLVGHARERR